MQVKAYNYKQRVQVSALKNWVSVSYAHTHVGYPIIRLISILYLLTNMKSCVIAGVS